MNTKDQEGKAWACGSNSCGQAGVDSIEETIRSPALIQCVAQWTSITLGDSHAAGISADGTVYTWGLNDRGQCASKEPSNIIRPTRVSALDSSQPATSIASGFEHTACVIDGSVFAWGSNEYGQCGITQNTGEHGSMEEISIWKPKPVRSLRSVQIVSVVCGYYHTICLTLQGSVYAWGSNSSGQLGLGDCKDRSSPQMLQSLWATPVISIAAGEAHTLALTQQGMVLSWGKSKHGQLGLLQQDQKDVQGVKENHSTRFCCASPRLKRQKSSSEVVNQRLLSSLLDMGISEQQAISGLEATNNQGVEVAVEWIFSHAFNGQGTSSEKHDVHGVIPDNVKKTLVQESDMYTPRRVQGLSHAISIAAGTNHSIVCTKNNVYSFGYNRMGQLGLNCRENIFLPQAIKELNNKHIIKAACGTSHTLFLSSDGCLYGCGSAEDFQQGSEVLYCSRAIPELILKEDCKHYQGNLADVIAGGYTTVLLQKVENIDFNHDSLREDLMNAIQKCISGEKCNSKSLTNLVEVIFASPELMNLIFSKSSGFGVNVEEIERVYKQILQCGMKDESIILAFQNATNSLIRDVQNNSNLLTSPESIQILLILFQNPLLSQMTLASSMNPKLCRLVMDCIAFSQQFLISWWSTYPASILAGRIVRPMQDYITCKLQKDCGQITPSLMSTLNVLALVEESNYKSKCLPIEEFYNKLISEKMDVLQHYLVWRQNAANNRKGFTFCSFPFLLNNEAKSKILQTEAHLSMHEMVQRSRMEHIFGGVFGNMRDTTSVAPTRKGQKGSQINQEDDIAMPRPDQSGIPAHHPDACIIRIRRSHLIQDALEEIARQNEHDLRKPLKVYFIGEEGVDVGGVKKEFFQLLCETFMQPDYGMFLYQAESRTYWFNGESLESEAEFLLIGIVVSLAIYNSVILDMHFPMCLFKKLLGQDVDLKDLEQMQPELARGLRKLLDWNGPGSVEDIFCATFSVEQASLGQMRTYNMKPGGADIAVTEENRQEYVKLYTKFILTESVKVQFNAFRKGFLLLCDGPALSLFHPQELEVLICGTPHLDFKALESNAKYEGGFSANSEVVVWLWKVVGAMTLEDKKKFLKFVTGSDRAPIGGLGKLKCLIQRAGPDTNRLPTSHTCFNTLLLPEYSTLNKLRSLLDTAIHNAYGFGLE